MPNNHVDLALAKEEYCISRGYLLPDQRNAVTLKYIGRNPLNQYTFTVQSSFNGSLVSSMYAVERLDGRTVTGNQEIRIPHTEHNPTKTAICHLFKQVTGKVMRTVDIAKIQVNPDTIDVVFHQDSMTFEHYLTIKRV